MGVAKWSGSIRTKLIASVVAVLTVIIAITTVRSRSAEISDLTSAQTDQLESYADLLANQLHSAIAFADGETAREVLDSLKSDSDIVAVTLYRDGGRTLYQSGTPSAWVEQAKLGVMQRRHVRRDSRSSVVVPVVAPEGPRGTLVLEMSDAQIMAHGRKITRHAILFGAFALLAGYFAVWLITRPLLRRLRRMADVATAIALAPDAQTTAVEIENDELGEVGHAFNSMVAQLEQRVQDRTARLASEMEKLARMESELRQAQKLESVGRLASGIAHEINTPVQFVSDSCTFIRDATKDVFEAMAMATSSFAAAARGEIPLSTTDETLAKLREEYDIAYLISEIPQAIDRAQQGLQRVATIVKSMNEFAHPDQDVAADADLNRAISTTLTVARSQYKYIADVETHFAELPPVRCYVGELNQAVLNMVVNAAHAIESATEGTGRRGKIGITTALRDEYVTIEITDDGCGIPPALVEKIYDPFFTTKELGKGTGQGLAIARSVVVDKHNGRLTVASQVGVGTTFTLWLPMCRANVQDGVAVTRQLTSHPKPDVFAS